ncbi:MAG TPA: AMP-binding protein [Oligoflexus sp.]|uniref:AMP-binding protein n=1 Tax=Oligoflexus sp. TaxID=1971216 RepID=UPI002D50BC6F|nr:AMP-binding protein [Oligoflexus sp.]HYX38855.1 AMP-binding protein [Oligoflexus sp.]
MSVVQTLLKAQASQPCWQTLDGFITYGDLEARIRRYATLLQSSGAQAGDHWAVRGWSALDTFALLLACLWQRVVLFPLPDRLPDAVHQRMMLQVPLQGFFVGPSVPVKPEMQGPITWDDEAPAVGIFTSGSTGMPKAIVHSWKSLSHSAVTTNEFYQVQPGDSWLLSLDPAHIGGLQIAVRCFLRSAVAWHLTEPKAVVDVLRVQAPSYISLVPTQLYRLLQDSQAVENLRHCKAIILGGAAASLDLVDLAIGCGLPVSVSYGSSETAAQCTALPPGARPLHPGDVGQLLRGWDYAHAGETLRLRGPASSRGFYQQTTFHALLDAEGWLTLPDRILCDQGRLTVLGRADGIFQVAGENISPLDIVQPLEPLRHDSDFIALPWHDAEYGTVPVLIVRSARSPDVAAVVALLQKHLTGVQRPRSIYWHQSDDIGKLSRPYYEKALEEQALPLLWKLGVE